MRRVLAALLATCLFFPAAAMAASATLSPVPVLHFDDANGAPLSGGMLFTYQAGTTTKLPTFTDASGSTPNPDPVILNARGECNCWLTPNTSYKFVLSPAGDSDPPTNPIYTVDNIASGAANFVCGYSPTVGTCGMAYAPTLAALQQMSTATQASVTRLGFYTPGDAPPLTFIATPGSCAVTDNAQCAASSNGNSWVASFPSGNADPREWGATATGFRTTGVAAANSTTITLQSAGFVNGQPIACFGCGSGFGLARPTGVTVTSDGRTGSTQWCAIVVPIDVGDGWGSASAEACATNGASSLNGTTSALERAGEIISWSAVASANGYAIYFGKQGLETFAGVANTTQWEAFGQTPDPISWLPSSPPTGSQGDVQLNRVVSGGGTTAIQLASATIGPASGATAIVQEDDTAALNAALASGLPLQGSRGVYRVTGPLSLSSFSGQQLSGCGRQCFIIVGSGIFNILNTSSTVAQFQGISDLEIDASDMAGGNAIDVANGPEFEIKDTIINWPFNGISIIGSSNNLLMDHVRQITEMRGNYCILIQSVASSVTGVAHISNIVCPTYYEGGGVVLNGNVPTIKGYFWDIQSGPNETLLENTIGAPNGPRYFYNWNSGWNGCWDACITDDDGNDVELLNPYIQSFGGGNNSGSQPAVSFNSSAKDLQISNGQIFGGATNGITAHGLLLEVNNTIIPNNGTNFGSIEFASDAVGGSVTGGGDYNVIAGDPVTTQAYGIKFDAGASGMFSVNGGAWIGSVANIENLASPAAQITINGTSQVLPSSIVNAAGNQTLAAATYSALYTGVAGAYATLDLSGFASGVTDSFDTAANIVGALPASMQNVGTMFRIRAFNHTNQLVTMAGLTGTTISGVANVPANGQTNSESYRDFVGTIEAVSPSPLVNIHGCSVAAGAAC